MSLIQKIHAALLLVAFLAPTAFARDIDFSFTSPRIPAPPVIDEVMAYGAAAGDATFPVFARIRGQEQKKSMCDEVSRTDCDATDWYQVSDPEISPNPPTIQLARVYYYYNGDPTDGSFVLMTYDSGIDRWTANIPIKAGLELGSQITYYILAVDSMGNVASETPSTDQEPCPDIGSWDDTLATPLIDSCQYATSHVQCGLLVSSPPGSCTSAYTLADRAGDVCGQPNSSGQQTLITGSSANKVDITGLTLGAGGNTMCARLGLGIPPLSNDPAPIEGYVLTFYNPDIPDPNPADTHLTNAFIMTYAPEAVGSDPTLTKVLWSGDCFTDPDNSDPYICKLISAVGDNPSLKLGYQSDSLRIITRIAGVGDVYSQSYSIIGSTSQSTYVVAQTGEINLSGGIPFWVTDSTQAMAYYHRNHSWTYETGGMVSAPSITLTSCSADGSANGLAVCPITTPPATVSKCRLDFQRSITPSLVDEYRVYRGATLDSQTAMHIGTVPEAGLQTYSFADTHANPNSETYHYWITSFHQESASETPLSDSSHTTCTVADAQPPLPPVILTAATPNGVSGKCNIEWEPDVPDPSLTGFWLSRDGVSLNQQFPLMASTDVTTYNFTDPTELTLGAQYAYTVTAVDRGGNTAISEPFNCTPQDLMPPDRVTGLLVGNILGKLGVRMLWRPVLATDLQGYRVMWCPYMNSTVDCRTVDDFTAFEGELFTETTFSDDTMLNANEHCFYVDACDDCNIQGTCDVNQGQPNCTGMPPGGADSMDVNCLQISENVHIEPPAFPQNVSCESSPGQPGIILSWDRVCTDSTGVEFADCINPSSVELASYMVVLGSQGAMPDISEAQTCIQTISVDAPATQAMHTDRQCPSGPVAFDTEATYCYRVYAADVWPEYSRSGEAGDVQEVCCQYSDTFAPPPPVATLDHDITTCTVTWQDPGGGTATYNGYRCAGDSCNASSTWAPVFTGQTPAGGFTFTDTPPGVSQPYTYCVTAVDAAGNQSDVFPQSAQPNCGACTPGLQATPPRNVDARINGAAAVAVWWERSLDDDAEQGAGYRVYRCEDQACSSPVEISGAGCGDLAADSGVLSTLSSAAPVILNAEPAGVRTYGVAYRSDCSDPATESTVSVTQALSVGADCQGQCIHVSNCRDYSDLIDSCTAINRIDTSNKGTDGAYLRVPVQGLEVFLADAAGRAVGPSALTDSNGVFHIVIDNNSGLVDVGAGYMVLLKIPVAEKSGVPCDTSFDDSQGNGHVVLARNLKVFEDDARTARVYGMDLPMAGGGRAEVGNANCDNSVNITDMVLFKKGFGASEGEANYRTHLDFDGNGVIDVVDFLILKKYFGMELDAAPTHDATLCAP